MKSYKAIVIIFIIGTLCYMPFVNKAVHIDSDLVVHFSRQILINPLNPPLGGYGENMIAHETTGMPYPSIFHRSPHPPLLPLFLSPVAYFAKNREWPFHLAMFLFYLLSITSVWYFFGLFFEKRLQISGTLLWTISPALLVNAQNIMWDVMITAFIIWALALFIHAKRTDSRKLLFYSGLITGLGAITKINIFLIYVLITGYLCAVRNWKYLFIWLIPAVSLPLLWVIHNLLVFGEIQYLSTNQLHIIIGDLRYRFERIISFLGGCIFLPVWWYWLIISNKKRLISYIPFLLFSIIWGILLLVVLKKPIVLAVSYVVFSSVGFWALYKTLLIGLKGQHIKVERHEGVLISGFSILYLLTMEILPHASVRLMLPILPFVIMVILDVAATFSTRDFYLFNGSAVLVGIIFSLSLCYADYTLCGANRKLTHNLIEKGYLPEKTWYYGRLSYDYYMHHNGFRNLVTDKEKPQAGDYAVEENIPGDCKIEGYFKDKKLVKKEIIDYSRFPLRTKGFLAGFYGNDRIPYSLNFKYPQKRFEVYEIAQKK